MMHLSNAKIYLVNLLAVWVCDRLKSGDTDITIKTLLSYDEPLPPSFILRVVSLLLLVDNVEVRTAAGEDYIWQLILVYIAWFPSLLIHLIFHPNSQLSEEIKVCSGL